MKNEKMKNIIISIIVILLVAVLVALICYAPMIARNRFMRSVESDNFQDASEIFAQNQENSPIKSESSLIIKTLDGKIERTLMGLYEEKSDFDQAEALAKLYIDFASSNDSSTKKGEILISTLEMYREIDALKEYIKEGKDFDALGKGLISTSYSDDETFVEVLSRSIDESDKKNVVTGIENAIDYQISRAEGNHSFMGIPTLLANKTVLSKYLLSDSEYNKLLAKINKYNQSRACTATGCKEWAKNKYCEAHKCEDDDCNNLKKSSFDYCSKHICAASGCDNYNYNDAYCGTHECNQDGCKNYASSGSYCKTHAKKTESSSYSSASSYFSNKYGTNTTKCVVSGCSNYIASSGDTNCCTSHSNRCGECRCYIDGDAMFCMSCLSAALR